MVPSPPVWVHPTDASVRDTPPTIADKAIDYVIFYPHTLVRIVPPPTPLIAPGMTARFSVLVDTSLPTPQMTSWAFNTRVAVASALATVHVGVRANMLRASAFEDAKKKRALAVLRARAAGTKIPPNLNPAYVRMVGRDGQQEEIPIDELY